MLRLTVTTTVQPKNSNTKNLWFAFEADYENIDDLHEALVDDGCILGYRIVTVDTGDGPRVVTKRVPLIIGRNAIALLGPCHFDYIDAPVASV